MTKLLEGAMADAGGGGGAMDAKKESATDQPV
jgi:hypothetical protein